MGRRVDQAEPAGSAERVRGILRVGLVVAALGPFLPGQGEARAQVVATPQGQSIRVGGSGSRYEQQYGPPEFRALDNDEAWPWPAQRSIRTFGVLQEVPEARDTTGARVSAPRYQICVERRCLEVQPVDEVREGFASAFPFWTYKEVEVVGAFAGGEKAGPAPAPPGFGIWEASLMPERRDRTRVRSSSLEALVFNPKGMAGRTVTVSGAFRGANLFDDLPPDTRRHDGDWVLRDGPYSIWVTGGSPKGEGWSLDPRSRSECRWLVAVSGEVATVGGYVYLRAKKVDLVRRLRDEERP